MKRLIALIIIFLPFYVHSQSIGLKVGLNKTLYSSINELTKPTFGLFYQHNFKRFLLSIEPGFASEGYVQSYQYTHNPFGGTPIPAEIKYIYKYIDIPVTLGYNIINKKIYAGPIIGISGNYYYQFKATSSNPIFNSSKKPSDPFELKALTGIYGGINFSDHLFGAINFRVGTNFSNFGEANFCTGFINLGYKF